MWPKADIEPNQRSKAGFETGQPMPPRVMWPRSAKSSTKTGYVEGQNMTVEYHWPEGACRRWWPIWSADAVSLWLSPEACFMPTLLSSYRNGLYGYGERKTGCSMRFGMVDSSQSPSVNEQRRVSTTEPPIGVDVKAELSAPPLDAAPQPAPVNPTTLAPSAKSFELMRQIEALAHEVAVASRRDSSDQCIKVQEGSNLSAGLQTVEPSIRVAPRDQFASYEPSIGRRTFLTLANFFAAARDRLASTGRRLAGNIPRSGQLFHSGSRSVGELQAGDWQTNIPHSG
jgi:hypothetical protein